jgi:hypothetical protein
MTKVRAQSPGVAKTILAGVVVGAFFAAAGIASVRYAPQEVVAGILKYAVAVVGVVWLFSVTVYNKLSDLSDLSGITFRQHRNIEVEIRSRLHWFWLRALFLALLAVMLYFPALLLEAKVVPTDAVFAAAGAALGISIFSLRRLLHELEEIRELRAYARQLAIREDEREKQVAELKDTGTAWEPAPVFDALRGANGDASARK